MLQFIRPVLMPTIVFVAVASQAADWPQFRHDAGRTAASAQSLPAELHLQWVREMPTPRPAFPGEVRLLYDASYEPVVMGKRMFVGSMVSDTVSALDTDTGKTLWEFFTDGPVRFAPLAWQDKVYAASDDGFLYCLHAKTGALAWKFRGLPEDQADRKLLGNGRLISLWPARGGPVLKDGVVYFAAGLWPSDGVFIHALDAVSGEPVWSNTDSNRIPKANMDHGVAQLAGLTPQGYLAVVGDKLVVPCGAQLPAFLDAKTGKLGAYTMGWGGRVGLPKGSWFVAGAGRHLSHSGDLYDITRANDEQFRDKRQGNFKPMLYPGGFTRVMIEPKNQRELGAFREPVITDETLYANDDQIGLVAYDLTKYELDPRSEIKPTQPRAADRYPDKWKAGLRERWTSPTKSMVHIKAGSRLYAAGDGLIQAIDIPQGGDKPTVSWQTKFEGTPHRMLAADGKLFVVTKQGKILAFGEEPSSKIVRYRAPRLPPWEIEPVTKGVLDYLKTTSANGGYVVLLGLKDRQAISQFQSATKWDVIAVERDAGKVAESRKWLHRNGLYGTRATVLTGDPLSYPLPPLLAGLIVCDDISLITKDEIDKPFLESIVRLLRPYGGQARLHIPEEKRSQFQDTFNSAMLDGVELKATKHYMVLSRMGGLPDAADWSHAAGNAANAGASQDRYLKPPLGMLWFDGSLRWHRKPGSAEIRISGGRAIVLADRMHAIDVFTGRRLWERELPPGVNSRSQIVAVGDQVVLGAGDKCLVLGAGNGKQLGEMTRPSGVTGDWRNIRVADDLLFATIGNHLVCMDHRSAELVWKHACGRSALSTAVAQDKVFCVELVNAKRGESVEKTGTKMRAFDLRSGKVLWEKPGGSTLRYSPDHELLISSAGVFDATTGETIRPGVAAPQLVGGKIVSGTGEEFSLYYLKSGDRAGALKWYRRGCTDLRSSCHLVTTRFKANAAFVDLSTFEITPLWNIRPGCKNNLFPAEGLLNVPNVTGGCECNYTPTSKAFAPLTLINQHR